MEQFTNGTGREVRRGKQRHTAMTGSAVLCLVLCLTVMAAAAVIFAGSASATGGIEPVRVENIQGIPAAQQTAPVPVQTGQIVIPIASVGPTTEGQGLTAAGTQSGGGFPWWILVPILLGLGLVAFLLARRRPTVEVIPASVPPSQRPYTTGTTTSTTTTTTTAERLSAATGAATAGVGPADQVVCPNCGTANALDENFCHECGQDLKATRAAMFAPPVDVVDEYTPYLETLSRVDEQLEYVLSRAKVTMGTAPGNDIVIDAAFNGSGTVAAVHAELRREDDGFVLADRGSETGVYVNEERVTEAALKDEDQVRIGDVQFIYRAPARP